MKKALLIGINYTNDIYNSNIKLRGCIDDIVNLQNALITNYGYESSNISVLRDDLSGCLPTRENILNGLKDIIESNAIEIWIHYSGHGSQISENNSVKSTNMDNILIPVDYKTAGFILDNELFEYIKSVKLGTTAIFTFESKLILAERIMA